MKLTRPDWYTKTEYIRKKENHAWSEKDLNKIFSFRTRKIPVDVIIRKLKLNVNRTKVYNMVRIMKKTYSGKCIHCGKSLTIKELIKQEKNRFKTCSDCREKNSYYKKQKRLENIKKGFCIYCGKFPPLKEKQSCMFCLSRTYRNRIIKGLCGICGENTISEGSTALCDVCLLKQQYKIT